MAKLQELTSRQIDEAVVAAVDKQVPVTVNVRRDKVWHHLHSRLLGLRDSHMFLAIPQAYEGGEDLEFSPAEKLGLSFKLKHHKHVFSAITVGKETLEISGQGSVDVLSVCIPSKMQRLQRRAYQRVSVPEGKVVRVSFWVGTAGEEPSGGNPSRPVWSGRVTDLSAGGFQLIVEDDEVWDLEVGESVGLRVAFGVGGQTVYADAQFRHRTEQDGKAVMGFQFLGLAHDRKSREVLQVLSAKVAEFQRIEQMAGSHARHA